MPERIQLKRTKGWRMPPNTVKVDRSTEWGNPFVIGETYPIADGDLSGEILGHAKIEDAADAVEAFRPWCEEVFQQWNELEPLRGKNLACWCKIGQPCHADVLLELANIPPAETAPSGPQGTEAALSAPDDHPLNPSETNHG